MSGTMPTDIIVGVDTHKHTHAAVAVTGLGACVAERTIKVGLAGYRELEAWARSLGNVRAFGPTWTVVLEKAFWPSSLRGRVWSLASQGMVLGEAQELRS